MEASVMTPCPALPRTEWPAEKQEGGSVGEGAPFKESSREQ